jgi:hypothetical protein
MIAPVSTPTLGSAHATCEASHGPLLAVTQQFVASEAQCPGSIPTYLVRLQPDEINVYTYTFGVTILKGSGGVNHG